MADPSQEDDLEDTPPPDLPSAERELQRALRRPGGKEAVERMRRLQIDTDPGLPRPAAPSDKKVDAVVVLAPNRLPEPMVIRDTQKEAAPPEGVWTASDDKPDHINIAGQTGKLGPPELIGGHALPAADIGSATIVLPRVQEKRRTERRKSLARWVAGALFMCVGILVIAGVIVLNNPGPPGVVTASLAPKPEGIVAATTATGERHVVTPTATATSTAIAAEPTTTTTTPPIATQDVATSVAAKPSAKKASTPRTAEPSAKPTAAPPQTATTTTAAPLPSSTATAGPAATVTPSGKRPWLQ